MQNRYILDMPCNVRHTWGMFTHERNALKEISRSLRKEFGDDIEQIVAFGSRVRGDFSDSSDFDILIIVRNRTPQKQQKIIDIIVDIEEKRGLSFSPLIKDAGAFAQERACNTPFYQNITREGISV